MNTKYGHVDDNSLDKYFDRLVGKIFKLLPLREENNSTINFYLESLLYELVGGQNLFPELKSNDSFVNLLMSLESLKFIDKLDSYKRKVFECINIAKKLKDG